MSEKQIQEAARLIVDSPSTVALTGAGISTESGIPDFRGPDGLWTKVDPMKFASVDAFLSDPKAWWETAVQIAPTLLDAKPNAAHKGLAKLEKMGLLQCIITQNVDGLHQRSGSQHVLEVHGNLVNAVCIVCNDRVGRQYIERKIKKKQLPPTCPTCGGILKLDAVLFGEALPQDVYRQAVTVAGNCRLMIVVGSSLTVYPAASLPSIATQTGARLIIVNQEQTPFDAEADLVFHSIAGATLTTIVEAVHALRGKR
ncbi:MAG: NAD-dependent protein deacylase [Promethearchaeota archaeon]